MSQIVITSDGIWRGCSSPAIGARQAPGEVRTNGVDRLAIMRRGRNTNANERCDAASALARRIPELSCDSIGDFDRDASHAHHKLQTLSYALQKVEADCRGVAAVLIAQPPQQLE